MFPISWLHKRGREADRAGAARIARQSGWRTRWLERAVFLAVTAGLAFSIYRLIHPAHAWVILIDGQPAAAVGSRKTAETILASVKKQGAGNLAPLANFDQAVHIERSSASDQSVVHRWEAQKRIGERLSLHIPAYRLTVNGKRIVTLASVDEVRRTVEALLSHYVPKGARLLAPPRIKEELALEEALLSPQQARRELLKPEQALEALLSPAVKPRVYRVQRGDTATRIASRHGISVEDMRKANPEVDLDRLQVGDQLIVAGSKPLVNVVSYVEETREVPVASWTQEISTPSLKPGQRRVIQQGQPGRQEVRVRVTYLNGQEVNRSTVYGKVTAEPVPGRVLVGEKTTGRSSRRSPESGSTSAP